MKELLKTLIRVQNRGDLVKKFDYPDGTIFSGELAFVPIPKSEGGGFKTVNLSTGEEYDSFGDNVFDKTDDDITCDKIESDFSIDNKVQENLSFPSSNNIEFDIDYDSFVLNDSEASKESVKTEKANAEKKKKKTKDEIYKNIHKGHRERMKKRFTEYGLENFSEHEVLEFLLYFTHERRDTNPIAHALIDEFGDINKVFKADMYDLKSVDGVGEESALLISFCRQLIAYLNANIKEKVCLADATSAGLFCCNYFMQHAEESFIAIMLDTKRCVQKIVVISRGTENETAYYPRNVIKATIKHRANMVLIAHNHTGNSVHPSNNDIVLSNEINKLLDGIGVPLVDHIICCGNLFTSLAERELIK